MAFIPTDYKVNLDIDDSDIMKIGLVIYIAIVALKIFKIK